MVEREGKGLWKGRLRDVYSSAKMVRRFKVALVIKLISPYQLSHGKEAAARVTSRHVPALDPL